MVWAATPIPPADVIISATDGSVTYTIRNDDRTGVTLSKTALTLSENSGTDSYTVALTSQPAANVTVTAMASGITLDNGSGDNTLTFTSMDWQRAQTVTVMASEALREDRVELTHTATGGYDGVTAVMEVRITGGDMAEMQAAQALWLPRFGLTVIEHMLDGLDERFTASSQPGLSGHLHGLPRGQALHATRSGQAADSVSTGLEPLGAGSVDRPHSLSRTLSLPKLLPSLLRGSHFTLSDEHGVSLWGRAAYSDYEDGADGLSTDGEVTTALLGIDHNSGQTLLGLALTYSDSDGEWQGESDEGELSGTLASILPYVCHDLTERLQRWGAVSYGQGDLQQTSQTGMESEHDLEQWSATAGLRGTLLERPVEEGGLTVRLTSDMTLARIESDDSEVMAGTEADTQRLRMGLAWSWQMPDKGLTVELRGRYLLEQEASERQEWGLSGSLRYKARPDSAHGPSFSLRQEYGNAPAASGLERLLSDSLTDALKEDNSQTAEVSSQWTLKGEWGFALHNATGIPYASLSASDAKRDLTLGWRLLSNPSSRKSELDIKAIRRQQNNNDQNHGIGAELRLYW